MNEFEKIFKKKNIDAGVKQLQAKIGLKESFFKSLLYDTDDWSFVIKLHALIEAVCASLLTFHFNEPKLGNIFSRLELSDKAKGKVRFLEETGLIDKFDKKFIYALSELRNKLVHDVKNCNIKLNDLTQSYDKNQMKNFAYNFGILEARSNHFNNVAKGLGISSSKRINDIDFLNIAKEYPKFHIWNGAYNFLIIISETFFYSDYLQSVKGKQLEDRNSEDIL